MSNEYFIVKDENGIPVGKRKVITKSILENAPAYVVNGSIVFSLAEFTAMQELSKNLKEIE
jgi:hypothetical protein